MAAVERAMVALRRQQSRHSLARLSARRGLRSGRVGALPDAVFQLLDAAEHAAALGRALTVTEAATALAVDQPRASRLAAQAADAGLLRREADQTDGRRSLLALTPDGHAAVKQIRDFRRQVIAEALRDWSAEDCADLARLLTRFVDDIAAITDE
ncbi:MarR family winged helix-turn-helix transcriptional regulator [Micromonospora eburnea]|nr:MarR family transcriptional regulator [Micromonospora eburnea]